MINITDIISLIKRGKFLKVVMSVLLGYDVLLSYYGDETSIYSIDYKT